jgi:outer membrane protein assembly factor BamB
VVCQDDDARQRLPPHVFCESFMSPSSSSTVGSQGQRSRTRQQRRVPDRRVLITVASLTAAIALVRNGGLERVVGPVVDHAVINIITLILGFSILVSLVLWLWRESSYSARVKRSVIGSLLLAVVAGLATLRIERVSGDLVPEFAWRWSPSRDQLLPGSDEIQTRAAAAGWEATPRDFPSFLGPDGDASIEEVLLVDLDDWAAQPPQLLWRQPIGAGWGGFAVVGDHAVTLEQRDAEEIVACYDVTSGSCEWAVGVAARHTTVLGGTGPRSTPTIRDGIVYAAGATGWLHAIDGGSGEVLWRANVLDDLGIDRDAHAVAVAWGRSGSPLVTERWVIVPGGGPRDDGPVSLAVYDRSSGSLAGTLGASQISYVSPQLMEIAGRQLIVTVDEAAVVGYPMPGDAFPEGSDGEAVFSYAWPGHSNSDASCSQPRLLPDNRMFISKGYGIGCAVFRIDAAGETPWSTEVEWASQGSLKTKFANVVIRDGHAYGLSDGILECVRLSDGKRAWKRGRYGQGQILSVGKMLLVLAEDGTLAVVEAMPEQYREVASFPAIEGQTWNNLCLSGDRLLVRNGEEAACYRLPLKAASSAGGEAAGPAMETDNAGHVEEPRDAAAPAEPASEQPAAVEPAA